MRVHEIAKELDIASKVAIERLNDLGVAVKSHANAISDADADRLRELLGGQAESADAKAETPVEAKPKPKPKSKPKAKSKPEAAPEPAVEVEAMPEPADVTPEAEAVGETERGDDTAIAAEEDEAAALSDAEPVEVDDGVTVRELAEVGGISPTEIITGLMAKGIMANLTQSLDAEVATAIAAEHGVRLKVVTADERLLGELDAGDEADLASRAPVVTIMGHVDHGKTHLLDSIRETDVVAGEAGGITQHIGASEVEWNGNRIVLIDTPGHQAFTRMRARGAQITDIVVLVVAADDGIMPQTIEAIDHARAANVPILVAINKIDLPQANVERAKQQLLEHQLTPEDWGGDTVCVPVSAKTKENLDDLLEMIILSSDLLELKANPEISARGTVLEAQLDRQRGALATLLVQEGTLRVGDSLVAGTESAKVRAMIDAHGKQTKEAPPATAVEVLGFSGVPEAGDSFQVVEEASVARKVAELRQFKSRHDNLSAGSRLTLEDLHARILEGGRVKLPVVLRADTQGSVQTISDALGNLSGDSVQVEIMLAAVGGITETDVLLASASNAIIVGFNVRPERDVAAAATRERVDLRLHTVIYRLIDEVKAAMVGQLEPTFEEQATGAAEVRDTFRVPRAGTVAGCYVTEGKFSRGTRARLVRDSRIIYEGKVGSLRRFKEDVKEVQQGYECGIGLENFNDVKIGDVIEAYDLKEIAPSL
ncbi:MAG TPA: translation initiation factor IF-2 [Acidobacteriota bacterium]|nr:translation initiation factor IF-2 [Acidobacteriota bacterium]